MDAGHKSSRAFPTYTLAQLEEFLASITPATPISADRRPTWTRWSPAGRWLTA